MAKGVGGVGRGVQPLARGTDCCSVLWERLCGAGVAGTAATFFFSIYQRRTIHVLDSVFKSVLQAAVWLKLIALMFYSEQK